MGENSATARILIVDKERAIAETLAMILNRSGFTCQWVLTGEEAVEVSTTFKPQILVCEVILDGMNGIETAILISQHVPGCKIFLCAGQPASVDLLPGARKRGYDFDIRAKPIHPQDLIEKLRQMAASQ
jgi:DNA-binding NtrC family response regulator